MQAGPRYANIAFKYDGYQQIDTSYFYIDSVTGWLFVGGGADVVCINYGGNPRGPTEDPATVITCDPNTVMRSGIAPVSCVNNSGDLSCSAIAGTSTYSTLALFTTYDNRQKLVIGTVVGTYNNAVSLSVVS